MTTPIYYTNKEKRIEFVGKVLEIYKDQIKGKVFIKPNLVSYEEYPTTTNLEILEAVITHLQDEGHEIICGDGQGVDVSGKKIEDHGIVKTCEKLGISFYNLYKEPMKIYRTPRGYKIKMSVMPFEADSIISLPNLKSHPNWELRMTGALKMVVGYFSTGTRIRMHMHRFPVVSIFGKNCWKMIAEANWLLMKQDSAPSHLTIMDAREPLIHANELRHGGEPVKLQPGYLLASNCPVVLDIFGFKLLKEVEPRYVDKDLDYLPYIKYAKEYDLCEDYDYELKEVLI
jgi:uncharacterized protein (DUF362 family)